MSTCYFCNKTAEYSYEFTDSDARYDLCNICKNTVVNIVPETSKELEALKSQYWTQATKVPYKLRVETLNKKVKPFSTRFGFYKGTMIKKVRFPDEA